MPPKEKKGPLEEQLNSYLSFSNQKKIREAGNMLKSAARERIENCNVLSGDEVKTLTDAMNKFVERKNETLARRVLRAIDGDRWDALRIELLSFSYAKKGHMERMGITFAPIAPYHLALQAVNPLDHMYQFEVIMPPDTLLESFITIDYPKVDPEEPSETMAKRKISGYFRLLDSANPNNCWRLVAELSLFALSSTSSPSEVQTTTPGADRATYSTFLTGRADFVLITLVGEEEPVIQDLKTKKELARKFFHPLTYETLASRLNSTGIETDIVIESVQYLVIEAKFNAALRDACKRSQHEGNQVHPGEGEVGELEGAGEESPPDTDGGTDGDASETDQEGEEGVQEKDNRENKVSEDEGRERAKANYVVRNDHGDYNEDEGSNNRSSVVLGKFLPQIVSECLALRSGPFRDKTTKFILSDGDNWIFGLVDCTKAKGGRVCYRTVVSVNPKDSADNRAEIRRCILIVLKLLAFWAVIPGAQLKKLFVKK